ncbi:MAG: phosphotransferase enzyme family protein [Sulfuricaulis sp.]
MMPEKYIANAFQLGAQIRDIRPYGQGLINDTFVVSTETGHRAILQRINQHAFPHPEHIMENLRTLTDHIRHRHSSNKTAARKLLLPEIYTTYSGNDFAVDTAGGFWRALSFVENTRVLGGITDITQAEEIGFALGRFHALIHDLDPARLHGTLPGFHDTPNYFERFTQACSGKIPSKSELRDCISFIDARRDLVQVLATAKREGKLVTHPIHGDTKLDNFLFDVRSNQAVSLIDLDTVQPGLIHFDIGDCLRSCANPAGESPNDTTSVRFELNICRAILKHYFNETRNFLTENDYHYLYDAIHLIPFELGLRFLTDHLEGNHYFKTNCPGQNLCRAMAQLRLTASIEEVEGEIKTLITDLVTA